MTILTAWDKRHPAPVAGLLDFLAVRNQLPGGIFWKLNLLFWFLHGAGMFCLRLMAGRDLLSTTWVTVLCEGFAVLLSLLLRTYYLRLGLRFEISTAVRVTLVSLAAAVLLSAWTTSAVHFAGWHPPLRTFSESGLLRLSYTWLVFLVWSYGHYWVRTELALRMETRFARQAKQEAHRMELNLLRSQLDPHFLFNSLNGISAEIRPHPDAAVNMVNELADYLRYSLDHRKQALATLGQEAAAMGAYLKIERARFGDSLRFEIHLTDDTSSILVPSFLLQPLVENAVKHGFDPDTGPMLLKIEAKSEGVRLRVEVTNTGHLDSTPNGHGVGLDNLRRRLDLHYPRRHSFSLFQRENEVVACLELEGLPCSA